MTTMTLVNRIVARVRSQWGFYTLVVFCLAAGVGATTAVFTLVDTVLLRPLPYPEPSELTLVRATIPAQGPQRLGVSPANFVEMRWDNRTFSSLDAVRSETVDLMGEGEATRLQGARVSPGLFATLGVGPIRGRTLRSDDLPGVAVLSEGAWTRVFGADPSVLGRVLDLGGSPTEVVGVVADAQAFPPSTDVWLPYLAENAPDNERHGGMLQVVGRLRPATSIASGQQDMDRVARSLESLYPANNGGRGIAVDDLRTPFVTNSRSVLVALMLAVAVFLTVACANVAGLFLVRVRKQSRSVALRAALGATRGRILKETLVEGAVLAGVGTALGAAGAALAVPRLAAMLSAPPPGEAAAVADLRVLVFTAVVALVTAALFSVGPALLSMRVSPASLLRGTRGGTGTRRDRQVQAGVVVAQAVLGVLLVLAASASVDRLFGLVRVDPGFRAEGAVTLRVPISEDRYGTFPQRISFVGQLEEALRAVPGVRAVGSSDVLPVGDPGVNWALSVEDHPPADPNAFEVARGRLVTPGYFEALGVPLLAGRGIETSDGPDGAPVIVVSRAFADKYWPGAEPIGRRIKRRTYDSDFPWMMVVGVVDDVRDSGLDTEIGATVYFPFGQQDTRLGREMSVVIRGDRDASTLLAEARKVLAQVDSRTPLVRAATLESLLADSISEQRASGRLLAGFAVGGLLLLALGVYGVMARTVQERTREVGLRLALGARTTGVMALVLRGGMTLLIAGLVLGLILGPLLLGTLTSALDEPLTPPSWAYPIAALLTVGVGLAASALPTWRAVRVDPVRSLREE